jgi:hypothetical protein
MGSEEVKAMAGTAARKSGIYTARRVSVACLSAWHPGSYPRSTLPRGGTGTVEADSKYCFSPCYQRQTRRAGVKRETDIKQWTNSTTVEFWLATGRDNPTSCSNPIGLRSSEVKPPSDTPLTCQLPCRSAKNQNHVPTLHYYRPIACPSRLYCRCETNASG